jgi:tetratricopeptide (TPR) repeat protein
MDFFIKRLGVKIIKNIGIKRLSKKSNQDRVIVKENKIEKRTITQKSTKPNANTLLKKGMELTKLKQFDSSLVFLTKALQLSNNNQLLQVKIYKAMAIAWEGRGNNNNSLVCYNRAIEISVEFLEEKYPTARYEMAFEELERLGIEIK